jgi:hypothetical protein
MKSKHFPVARTVLILLAGLGTAGPALAHEDEQSLGTAASATDYFKVNCAAGTQLLRTQLMVTSVGGPAVSVQTLKGKKATNTTDLLNGDNAYSPAVENTSKAGIYHVLVNKNGEGAVDYLIQFHCLKGSTEKDNIAKLIQNQ